MKKWQKASIALAAIGTTMFTAAPAFADAIDLSAAGSAQWQNGSDAMGSYIDQNSNVSVGQVQADNYYNYTQNFGGNSSQNIYTVDDGHHGATSSLVSSTNTSSNGGSSWTKGEDFYSQGASVSQSQSQIIQGSVGCDEGWGARQGQVAGAVSGGLGYDGLSGGVSLSYQKQNGVDALQATMSQTSNVNTSYTTAGAYQHDVNNGWTKTNTNQYTDGALVTSTSQTDNGGASYTQACDYSNSSAGLSQDQNQVVGMDGQGGTQFQAGGALTGQVDDFWL